MTKILVVGGAGYIGSHTVKALIKEGFKPIVLDNLVNGNRYIVENVLKTPLIIGQAGDKELLKTILKGEHPKTNGDEIDAIINFAAYTSVRESIKNPSKYYRNNLGDSLSMMEVLVDNIEFRKDRKIKPFEIPVIFSSSCATYGIQNEKYIPIKESTPQNPLNPYGKSKFMMEQILSDFSDAYGLPSITLRYFNAAGADPECDIGENHQPETHLIPLIFDALANKKKSIKVFGDDYPTKDGTCIRDYIHVNDLANAHIIALKSLFKRDYCGFYNVGTGRGHSIFEVIEICKKVTNLDLNIEISARREGDSPVLVASPEKIIKDLGWKPLYPKLEIIVEHAWRWYMKINSEK